MIAVAVFSVATVLAVAARSLWIACGKKGGRDATMVQFLERTRVLSPGISPKRFDLEPILYTTTASPPVAQQPNPRRSSPGPSASAAAGPSLVPPRPR